MCAALLLWNSKRFFFCFLNKILKNAKKKLCCQHDDDFDTNLKVYSFKNTFFFVLDTLFCSFLNHMLSLPMGDPVMEDQYAVFPKLDHRIPSTWQRADLSGMTLRNIIR